MTDTNHKKVMNRLQIPGPIQESVYRYEAQLVNSHTKIAELLLDKGSETLLTASLTSATSEGLEPTYVPVGNFLTTDPGACMVFLNPIDSIAS